MQQVGIVVIGRNEAARLGESLRSALAASVPVIYVDSGSLDQSVPIARSLQVPVLLLDQSQPYTAARARNAGLTALVERYPQLQFVQFVDGDCQLSPGWISAAVELLQHRPDLAAVTGILREKSSQRSLYTRLCHIEWTRPVGEIEDCGGLSMVRVQAFQQVRGFNPTIIAGEDTELFVRLRLEGWKLWSLDAEMACHDADLLQFHQWWLRTVRSGYAYAEGNFLHGRGPLRHWVRENRSIWLWGCWLPLLALLTAWWTYGLSLVGLVLLGGWTTFRISQSVYQQGHPLQDAWLYAMFCMLGKFPQILGQLRFYGQRWTQRSIQLIEYKGAV